MRKSKSPPFTRLWITLCACVFCNVAFAQQGTPEGDKATAAPSAPAAPAPTFKERYERAVSAFKTGQYDRAITEFQAAYELRPQPLLLFNLAQAHRKAGNLEVAKDLYERYLREDPKQELRTDTQRYLQEIETTLEERKRLADEEAKKKAEEDARALQAALLAEPPPVGYDKSGRLLKPPSRPFKVLKWVAGAAGVAAVATGVALMLLDGRPSCDLQEGQFLCPKELNTLPGGVVSLSLGAALLGTSAAFFVLDYKRGKEGTQSAALTFSGRF